MIDQNKFHLDKIELEKGTLTELEDRLYKDVDDKYLNQLHKQIEEKIKFIEKSDFKNKEKAIAALKAFLASIHGYAFFLKSNQQSK